MRLLAQSLRRFAREAEIEDALRRDLGRRLEPLRCQADHLPLQLFVDHAVSQIAVRRRFVGALGETLALLAELDVTFLG